MNFVGNRLTLESTVYGLVTGMIIAGVMIWSTCVFSVYTTIRWCISSGPSVPV